MPDVEPHAHLQPFLDRASFPLHLPYCRVDPCTVPFILSCLYVFTAQSTYSSRLFYSAWNGSLELIGHQKPRNVGLGSPILSILSLVCEQSCTCLDVILASSFPTLTPCFCSTFHPITSTRRVTDKCGNRNTKSISEINVVHRIDPKHGHD